MVLVRLDRYSWSDPEIGGDFGNGVLLHPEPEISLVLSAQVAEDGGQGLNHVRMMAIKASMIKSQLIFFER